MPTASIPEPVASITEAVNRHDETAFLGAFPADGVVDDWGRTFAGHAAIRQRSDEEFIGSRGVLTPEEVRTGPDCVTVIGDWRSSWANGRSRFEFRLHDDRIQQMTIREG